MLKYLYKLAVVIGLYFFLVGSVSAAAANLSLQVEQPKTPTSLDTFNITFVALDITNKPVTVKCFKQGPSDSSYSQFGSDINLSNGGNTDSCQVDTSVLNAIGIYNFYVTANTDTESITSPVIKIDFNNSNPGNPTNYSKEKINSCDYKIKFRTADDSGKTSKVVIYRSDATNFKANSSAEISTIIIGSNTDGEIINSVPDCNKTYYYVLKAVDYVGNSSDLIGDSFTTTVITQDKTGKVSKSLGLGAIPVGKSDKKSKDGSTGSDEVIEEVLTGTPGAILGEQANATEEGANAEVKTSGKRNLLLGLIGLCVIVLVYVERKAIIRFLR